MAVKFRTGKIIYYRKSVIKLRAEQRKLLETQKMIVLQFPVEWLDATRIPVFAEAYEDPGGTDIWGAGPYLKVPNIGKENGGDGRLINRLFCPFGYPPDRLRISRHSIYVQISRVELKRVSPELWVWLLTLAKCDAHNDAVRH